MNILKRANTWYAFINVPVDVQSIIGKTRLLKSTQTGDKRLATQRAAVVVAGWKRDIALARGSAPDEYIAEALSLARCMQTSPSWLVQDTITEEVMPRIQRKYSDEAAKDFELIASGQTTALQTLLPSFRAYETARGLATKTVDQTVKDVDLLIVALPTPESLTPDRVQTAILNLAEKSGLSASSITRMVGFGRAFFKFLQHERIIGNHVPNPFVVPVSLRKSKRSNAKAANKVEPWLAFDPMDIEGIYNAIDDDLELQQLVKLAAYTGARIEEICSLKVQDVDLNSKTFAITDSKTEAGIRRIPIHSKLIHMVTKMVSGSSEYLLSGLTFNKYGDRSNAIGKRFGRLKTKLGYSDRYVFHSIRKTVVTMLENAGVSENLAADIVGHEKPRITYGLYSGGASVDTMRPAVEKLKFKF